MANKLTGETCPQCSQASVTVPRDYGRVRDASRRWCLECGHLWEVPPNPAAVALGRLGGLARAARLTPTQRQDACRRAAQARWAQRLSTHSEEQVEQPRPAPSIGRRHQGV